MLKTECACPGVCGSEDGGGGGGEGGSSDSHHHGSSSNIGITGSCDSISVCMCSGWSVLL